MIPPARIQFLQPLLADRSLLSEDNTVCVFPFHAPASPLSSPALRVLSARAAMRWDSALAAEHGYLSVAEFAPLVLIYATSLPLPEFSLFLLLRLLPVLQ